METLVKKTEYTYNEKELANIMKKFLADAKQIIINEDYSLTEKSEKAFKDMDQIIWENYFGNMSKKMKKNVNKRINFFNKKRSLSSMNRLFHFIHTIVLAKRELVKSYYTSYYFLVKPDWIDKVKVDISLKEKAIQDKRKKWKEAQRIADELLSGYKEEKGNYYKRKI